MHTIPRLARQQSSPLPTLILHDTRSRKTPVFVINFFVLKITPDLIYFSKQSKN